MIKIIWTAKDETELRLTQNGMKPAEACPRCGSTEFHLEDKPTTIIGKCNNCLRMIFWHSKTISSTKFFIEEGEVP